MNARRWFRLRAGAAIVAVASPVTSHMALAMGRGYGAAAVLAAVQAVAAGVLLAGMLPGHRWMGGAVSALLLLALGLGWLHGPHCALLAMAGTAHGILYSGLLVVFAGSLRRGRVAVVTWVASRLNPTFHAGMVPYTRGVTLAWAVVFGGQLVLSGGLLAADVLVWQRFVTLWHVVPVVAMAVGEAFVRRWRWRHEHSTSLVETIRGTRRLMQGR